LKLSYETPEQIARRSGIPAEGLSEKLESMWKRGQIESREEGGKRVFRLAPWVVGIYEYQLKRMDKEFAQLVEEYAPFFGPQLVMTKPRSCRSCRLKKTSR
jgi:sugar-specific transcriptional regulator TrmB